MSYTKTNWQRGDIITAEKLNHAEQGIYDATEAAASGGGADIVFQAVQGNTESFEFTIVNGSMADIVAKLAEGEIPSAELYMKDSGRYLQLPLESFVTDTDEDDSILGVVFYFTYNKVMNLTTYVRIDTYAAEIIVGADGTIDSGYIDDTSCSLALYTP